ncbi:conserved hypothetical protein [Curtobacterium sp. 8I-2]|nr:conserved hypothetical protein [Curtobacterium sp. 8I-2]
MLSRRRRVALRKTPSCCRDASISPRRRRIRRRLANLRASCAHAGVFRVRTRGGTDGRRVAGLHRASRPSRGGDHRGPCAGAVGSRPPTRPFLLTKWEQRARIVAGTRGGPPRDR